MKLSGSTWFGLGFVSWAVVSLAPYLVVGETWGTVWFAINSPLAGLGKRWDVLDWQYPYFFVAVVTLADAALAGGLLRFFAWALAKLRAARNATEPASPSRTGSP